LEDCAVIEAFQRDESEVVVDELELPSPFADGEFEVGDAVDPGVAAIGSFQDDRCQVLVSRTRIVGLPADDKSVIGVKKQNIHQRRCVIFHAPRGPGAATVDGLHDGAGIVGFVGSGGVDHILVDHRKAADLRWRLRREWNLGPCCAAVGGAEEAGAAADRTRPADGRGGEPDTAQIDRPNTFDRCLELLDPGGAAVFGVQDLAVAVDRPSLFVREEADVVIAETEGRRGRGGRRPPGRGFGHAFGAARVYPPPECVHTIRRPPSTRRHESRIDRLNDRLRICLHRSEVVEHKPTWSHVVHVERCEECLDHLPRRAVIIGHF
jgi:hypothetical protein